MRFIIAIALSFTVFVSGGLYGQAMSVEEQSSPSIENFEYGEYSYFDLQNEKHQYFKGYLTKAYREFGKRSDAWDADAEALLKDFELYITYVEPGLIPYKMLSTSGLDFGKIGWRCEKLMDQSCNDPLVLFAMFRMHYKKHFKDEHYKRLTEAYKLLPEMKYPVDIRFLITQFFDSFTRMNYEKLDESYFGTTLDIEAVKFFQFMKDKPELRRVYFSVLEDWFKNSSKDVLLKSRSLAKTLEERVDELDPWMYHMFRGVHALEMAWAERGGGWSREVTSFGWQGFDTYSRIAAEHLKKAHEIEPKFAEAAALLIRVTMGASDSIEGLKDEWYWFRQAIAAQHDYHPAYRWMSWAMRPRWGGSHLKMYLVGLVGLNSDRYDTRAPLELRYSIKNIISDTRLYLILEDPKVRSFIVKMFEKLAENESYQSNDVVYNYLLSSYMTYCWQMDMREKSRKLAIKLGDNLDMSATALPYKMPLDLSVILAYTGNYAERLTESDKAFAKEDYDHSLRLLDEILVDIEVDDSIHEKEFGFIKKRFVYIRMLTDYINGEWTELIDEGEPNVGWEMVFGDWEVVDGGLEGASKNASYREGLMLKHSVDFGHRFKVRGKATLMGESPESYGDRYQNIALFYHALVEKNCHDTALRFCPLTDEIALKTDQTDVPSKYLRTKLDRTVNFEVHVSEEESIVFVDGEEIGRFEHAKAPADSYKSFGIGAYTNDRGVRVRFDSLEIKKSK
ncbi:hypothetical protein JD969_15325 [Planctomycetota bacterium]|nr:hypothetical protein JD969_15325 [Planctomycetota bacterium]